MENHFQCKKCNIIKATGYLYSGETCKQCAKKINDSEYTFICKLCGNHLDRSIMSARSPKISCKPCVSKHEAQKRKERINKANTSTQEIQCRECKQIVQKRNMATNRRNICKPCGIKITKSGIQKKNDKICTICNDKTKRLIKNKCIKCYTRERSANKGKKFTCLHCKENLNEQKLSNEENTCKACQIEINEKTMTFYCDYECNTRRPLQIKSKLKYQCKDCYDLKRRRDRAAKRKRSGTFACIGCGIDETYDRESETSNMCRECFNIAKRARTRNKMDDIATNTTDLFVCRACDVTLPVNFMHYKMNNMCTICYKNHANDLRKLRNLDHN